MKIASVITAMLLSVSALTHASTLGLDLSAQSGDALGNVGYAIWDTFPSFAFTNRAADDVGDSANLTGLTLLSEETASGVGVLTGSGQRLYSGNFSGTPGPFDLTIAGTLATDADYLELQLKFTAPGTGTALSHFFFNFNNLPADAPAATYLYGTSLEGANNFQIVKYVWDLNALGIDAGESFTLEIGSASDHVSLDAIVIAVPEPSRALLCLGALGFIGLRRRRR